MLILLIPSINISINITPKIFRLLSLIRLSKGIGRLGMLSQITSLVLLVFYGMAIMKTHRGPSFP